MRDVILRLGWITGGAKRHHVSTLARIATLAGLSALTPSPARPAYPLESQFQRFSVGVPVIGFAIGDITGDGRPDIVACAYGSDVLVTYRNYGGGRFLGDQALSATSWPWNVVLVDVTGDGQLDAVVTQRTTNIVRVFPSVSEPSYTMPVGTAPQGVAAGDIDGDGVQDLVVTNWGSANISVLIGAGGGNFPPQQVYSAGPGPTDVVTGDFNGDGYTDVAIAFGSLPYNVGVFMGSQTGVLSAPVHYSTGGPSSVRVADLDLDGDMDLAVSGNNQAIPLLNDGAGHFHAGVSFTIGSGLRVGDLNGDGVPDLIGFDDISKQMMVALGTGNGLYASTHAYETDGTVNDSTVQDMNGDGLPDIVASAGDMCIYFNKGNGYFGPQVTWFAGNYCTGVALGKFNGDQFDDLVVAPSADSTITYFSGSSAGFVSPPQHYFIGHTPTNLITGKFDNDNFVDAVVSCGPANLVTLLPGTGTGAFGARTDYSTASSPAKLASGKFNGDSYLDIAVACRTASAVSVLLNSGAWAFLPKTNYATASFPEAVAVGDLNHDGVADLVVACSGGLGKLSVLLGHGDGTFGTKVNYSSGDVAKDVALAYVDADSNLDAVVANYSGLAVLRGNGLGGFGPPSQTNLFLSESIIARDFDGDGHVDVALTYSSGQVTVLLGNGDGTFRDRVDYGTIVDTRALACGDVNGDGWPDLIAANRQVGEPFNTLAGSISLLRNNALGASGIGPFPGGAATAGGLVVMMPPWPNPSAGPVTTEVAVTGGTILDFLVADVQGRAVRSLPAARIGSIPGVLRWDGRTDAGEPARSGIYWLVARGSAGSASRRITIVR